VSSVASIDPAPGPQSAPRTSHLDAGAFGDVAASVSLFQAALTLPVTLALVPGRDGLDLRVTAVYSSGAARSAQVWNTDAPTGVLGLGWSVSADRIVVEGKTSENPLDGRFLLQTGGVLDPLVWYGSDGAALLFQCASRPLWRIRYDRPAETWTVLRDDGTTAVYGSPSSGAGAVMYGVMWGNWIGASRAASQQLHRYPVAWHLAALRSTGGSAVSWHYTNEEVPIAGTLSYTRATYLDRVTGPDGEAVEFRYEPKEPAEYTPPHQTATGQADPSYQDWYEDRYLAALDVLAGSGAQDHRYTLSFDYELGNASGSASSAFTKRFLTAIRQTRHGRLELPATRFAYQLDPAAANPGALTSIRYPEGGTATITYRSVALGPAGPSATTADFADPDDVFRTSITVPRPTDLPGAVPLVFQGPDYVVIAWYSETSNLTEVQVYSVGGRWSEPEKVRLTGRIRTDGVRFAAAGTFFALYLASSTGTGPAAIQLFRKKPHRFGKWAHTPHPFDRSATEITAETTLTAGNDFAVLHLGGEPLVHRFWWNPLTAAWTTSTQSRGPSQAKLAVAARGEYYAIAWYDQGSKRAECQIFHLDVTGAWKASLLGTASDQFDWNSRYATDLLALGDSFAVLTYTLAGSPQRRLRLLRWKADFSFAGENTLNGQYDRSAIAGSLVGNGPLLLRFNGDRWLDYAFAPSTGTVQYAYGEDLAIRSVVEGSTTRNSVVVYQAATSTWSPLSAAQDAQVELASAPWPPSSSGQLTTAGSAVRWREPNGTLRTIGALPVVGAVGSLHNVGPSHLIYQNDPSDRPAAATTVRVVRNGEIGETVVIAGQRIAIEDSRFAMCQMAGPRVFVTYPAAFPFATTPQLRLHRIIERSLNEHLVVPVVAGVAIDSGMQVVRTDYDYDATRAVFDPSGTAVLFPEAVRIIGPGGAGGRAEYSYHTGLPEPASPADEPYSLFTGMLRESHTFDADGFEVASTAMAWAGLDLLAGSASPAGVMLKATLPVLTRTQAGTGRLTLFRLPVTLIPELDAGQLPAAALAAFAAAGLPLSAQARVVVVTPGVRWDIADGAENYPVGRERDAFGAPAGELTVYGTTRKAYTNEYDPATGLLIRQEATELGPDGTPHVIVRALLPAWRVPRYAAMRDVGLFADIAAEEVTDTTAGIALSASQVTYRSDWPAPAPQSWSQYESWTWRADAELPPPFDRGPDGDRSAWVLGERFTARNRFGVPVVSVDATGLATSVLFDTQDRRAVATFVNLDLTAPVPAGCCLGFEPYERTQGWRRADGLPLDSLISTDGPHTGTRCLRLADGAGVVADFELPAGSGRAFFSCWIRTEPGYSPGPADGWFFDVRPVGGDGSVVRFAFPVTDGGWQRIQLCLDHPGPDHPDGASATSVSCRGTVAGPLACFVDDLRLVPLEGGVSSTVYAGDSKLPTAAIDVNNSATMFYYDNSLRLAAAAGPGSDQVGGLGGFAYARGSDADPRAAGASEDRFDAVNPNARTVLNCAGGGTVEQFPGGDGWRARWTASPPGAWQVADGVLGYHGDGLGTLTLRDSEEMSWYGVRVDVQAGGTVPVPVDGVGVGIGDVTASWDTSGEWRLARAGAVIQRAPGPPPESADWILIAQPRTVLLLVDGRQILAHRFGEPVSGALVLTVGGTVAGFSRITVFRSPSVQVEYQDGVGITRQSQQLDAEAVNVSGVLFDELGRASIQVKTMAYPGAVPGFRGTYATGLDPQTGKLSGDVTEYYDGSGGRSDDQGYPYTRQRLEQAATGRLIETGQPGAVHAVAPGATHTTRVVHGLKIDDGFLDHLPAGRLPQQTVTDPDGRVEIVIQDPAGRELGVRQAPGAGNIRTAFEYDRRGDLVGILGPDRFAPRPDQDPQAGAIRHDVDGLSNIITDYAADTGASESVYDDRGLLRFALYADGRGAGPDGLDRIVYHRYDRLGRRIETGEIERVFDRTELRALAGTAWPQDAPGWRERLCYDGDGTQPNAVGRGWAWTRNSAPGLPPVQTVLDYDESGRVTACAERQGEEPAYRTRYGFSPGGLLDRIAYPSQDGQPAGLVVCHSYDLLGRLARTGTPDDPAAFASYRYTAAGAIDTETLTVAGAERQFCYNSPGMITAVESGYLTERVAYWEEPGDDGARYYGGQASRASFHASSDGGAAPASYTWLYSYAADGRLRTARNTVVPGSDFGVGGPAQYDANGNLLRVRNAGVERVFGYAPDGNRLVRADGVDGYSYDAAGRTVVTPDPLVHELGTDRVTGFPSYVRQADGSRTELVTGGSGNHRWSKTLLGPDGAVRSERRYLCAAGAAPLTEQVRTDGGSGWHATSYVYGLGGLVAVLDDGAPRAAVFRDRLGSPRLLVAEGGAILGRYDYRPFGDLMAEPAGQRPDLLRYRFLGREWDAETGLVDFGARLYHPRLGRFYGTDPAGTGTNPYLYAGGDPVNLVDPGGDLFFVPLLIAVAVGAAIGGGTAGITAAAQGASGAELGRQIGIGALVGAVTGAVSFGIVSGATAVVAASIVPVTGTVGTSLGFIVRGVATAMITGAIEGSVSGGLGQILGNVLDGKRGDESLDGVGEAIGYGAAVGAGTMGLGSLVAGSRSAIQRSAQRVVVLGTSTEATSNRAAFNRGYYQNRVPGQQTADWNAWGPHVRNPTAADRGSRLEVVTHGNGGGQGAAGRPGTLAQWSEAGGIHDWIDARELARNVNAGPLQRFKQIDLLACNTGTSSFAQQFATESRTLTRAANSPVDINRRTGNWLLDKGKRMLVFHPDERITALYRFFGY
jgi:RHS repeat-associated protein